MRIHVWFYFGCLDLYLGVWTCLRVQRPGPGPGPGQDQAGTMTRPGPGPGPGRAQSQDRALRCLRHTSKKAPPRKYNIPYTLKCVILCFSHFLWNFANMASPAEMTITTRTASKFSTKKTRLLASTTYLYIWKCVILCFSYFLWNFANMASPADLTITTRTASKFCTKRRALQLPIFFLELNSWVTTGITEPWPECQPEEPWPECHCPSTTCSLFADYLAATCSKSHRMIRNHYM